MPNHVHILVTPLKNVSTMMQRLKGITAREANRQLGLSLVRHSGNTRVTTAWSAALKNMAESKTISCKIPFAPDSPLPRNLSVGQVHGRAEALRKLKLAPLKQLALLP